MKLSQIEKLENEIQGIEKRLNQIQHKIDELENEKEALLIRKQDCTKVLKALLPSSVGGTQKDNLNEWTQNSNLKNFKLKYFRTILKLKKKI